MADKQPSIYSRITAHNAGRIPAYTAMKYGLLCADPFRFFRGTCPLFYEDLSKNVSWKDPTRCWVTGDLHLENFGTYKGDDKVVYFDLNDFDEACLAPASWELVRLLTSIHVAAPVLGIDASKVKELCGLCTATYIAALLRGKPWVIEKDTAQGLLRDFITSLRDRKRSAFIRQRTVNTKAGLALRVDGVKTFALSGLQKKDILTHSANWIKRSAQLEGYTAIDAVFRLAGTGSVGLERYALLLQHTTTGKLRLLDMKEARPSATQPYIPVAPVQWKNDAERIVTLQKFVQHVAPSLLQPVSIGAKHYVVKALQPTQDRMDLRLCRQSPGQLEYMVTIMAKLTASGQLRSGGRMGSSITDELIAFAADAGQWSAKVNAYAKAYAKKVVADYKEFSTAAKDAESV
jgi:uncharacterized protein (DUF2252 family)